MGTRTTRYLGVPSWLMGVSIAVGLLALLNQAQIPYFLYYPNTTNTILISPSLDPYLFFITNLSVPASLLAAQTDELRLSRVLIGTVWLGGLVLLPISTNYGISMLYLSLVILVAVKLRKQSAETGWLILGATSVIALIECASAYYWVTSAFSPQALFGVASQDLETKLTYAPYPIAPVLLLIIMFSWVWVPILNLHKRHQQAPENNQQDQSKPNQQRPVDRRFLLLALDLFAILSLLVFYFLYAAGQTWIVGVDSVWRYLTPLNELSGVGTLQAFQTSFSFYHGIYLGLLLVIDRTTGLGPFLTVKYAPLFLAFLTPTLTFLTFRKVLGPHLALLGGLCAILWIPTTIGIWSGIQDNWTAYILWIFWILCYLNAPDKFTLTNFLSQSILSVGILVVHPWTWGVFLAVSVVAALVEARRNLTRGLTLIISVILLAVPIGVGAFFYIPGLRGDIANAFSLYLFPFLHFEAMLNSFTGAWLEMWTSWSSFLSPTLILIAFVGAYSLKNLQGGVKGYLIAWLAVWCVGSILVAPIGYLPTSPATSETQLWRMLYLSPLPILLALGLSKCFQAIRQPVVLSPVNVPRLQPAVLSMAIAAFSLPLFLFSTPLIRLGSVIIGCLTALILANRFGCKDSARTMTIIMLLLIVVNAALRSLYPLLLDPHNLLPSSV